MEKSWSSGASPPTVTAAPSLTRRALWATLSATKRYYAEDIAEPSFSLNAEDSTITVPTGAGIGVEVQIERVERAREQYLELRKED